jgi:hypothetical protein
MAKRKSKVRSEKKKARRRRLEDQEAQGVEKLFIELVEEAIANLKPGRNCTLNKYALAKNLPMLHRCHVETAQHPHIQSRVAAIYGICQVVIEKIDGKNVWWIAYGPHFAEVDRVPEIAITESYTLVA